MDAVVYDKVGKEAKKIRDVLYGIYPQETITDAAIASFDDGADSMPAEKLVANIEPVQDLHGYDHPCPAGGGKNKLKNTAVSATKGGITFTVNDDGTVLVNGTATDNAELVLTTNAMPELGNYVLSGCPTGGGANTYWINFKATNSEGESDWHQEYGSGYRINNWSIQNVGIYVKTGTTINNLLFKPMIRLATETDATFAPYENICPISGFTGANVTRTGKNLLALPFVHFQAVAHNKENAFFVKAGTYTISWSGSTAASWRLCVFMCDEDGNELADYRHCPIDGMFYQTSNKQWITGANGSDKKHTITVVDDCYIRLYFALGDTLADTVFYDVQLESGSTQTDFEAYDGETISVTFPTEAGTVYGGTLTLNSDRTGTLVVDRAEKTFYGGDDERWSQNGNDGVYVGASLIPNILRTTARSKYPVISNQYTQGATGTAPRVNGVFNWNDAITALQFRNDNALTVASFKEALASNPLQIVYYIANPQTYQLTAEQISDILTTIYGTNNIWADTGDIKKLTYRADLGKFIDSHITAAVANALNA